ncbi:hypothetical protein BO82DRAFT_429389 [Aspergillus uvarum CBS 121591]|uniref:Uncharacterized protein n=1 Tax=Aspergillus uvarum CBS 121591 TaxID=1448315 RepID=A0A319D2T5_9EURO|nr:hypothetical protein BO82DRAFT_429389 [Aspergillus uvarum CBS 121591]PYH85383.1 hypothetical protein BO82DRAFT_429389 [Aspergillus uvarum CBS 121591]
MQPPAADTLPLTNMNDRRVLVFWLLEIVAVLQFIVWLVVVSHVAAIPVGFRPSAAKFTLKSYLSPSSNATILHHSDREGRVHPVRPAQQAAIDLWFGLCFPVVVDAFAVVLTFNRALIRKFHNAVSQRLVFLASMILWAVWSWNAEPGAFAARHPVLSLAGGFLLYGLLGSILDTLETHTTPPARWATFAEYSKTLGRTETSWAHAATLAAVVGGLGLLLTWLIPAPWSAGLPVIHILSESLIVSTMGAGRTPRYISLCSPLFFATVCMHWGVVPVSHNPRLSITPLCFLGLVLLSRLLLDAHLSTVLRSRPELEWSRQKVLISTPRLLAMCIVMLVCEYGGLRVITYIKPISVLVFFGLGIAGYMGAAVYNIVLKLSELPNSPGDKL